MEDPGGHEETEPSEKQQYDPAGLGDSDNSGKRSEPVMSSGMPTNGFPNIMSLNTGFNGMDYNPMMQFMSGNMGSGLANFNPIMGKFDITVSLRTTLTLPSRNAKYGDGSNAGDVWEHG